VYPCFRQAAKKERRMVPIIRGAYISFFHFIKFQYIRVLNYVHPTERQHNFVILESHFMRRCAHKEQVVIVTGEWEPDLSRMTKVTQERSSPFKEFAGKTIKDNPMAAPPPPGRLIIRFVPIQGAPVGTGVEGATLGACPRCRAPGVIGNFCHDCLELEGCEMGYCARNAGCMAR
jgi:hypothetical protein